MVIVFKLLTQEFLALKLALEDHREELDFVIGEVRMPKVQNEVDAGGRAIMPGLMVEGVIENDAFILLEVASFIPHSHSRSLNAYERKMNSKLFPCWAIVRGYMGTWGDGAEEGMEVVSWNNLLKNLDGLRDLLTIFFKLDVM